MVYASVRAVVSSERVINAEREKSLDTPSS